MSVLLSSPNQECRFHVGNRALFEELKEFYPVLDEKRCILNAPYSDELRAYTSQFYQNRAASRRLFRGAVDDSRRLHQSEELDALKNQNREASEVTISSLDELADALTGAA